jgi:hypothetical protein
MSFHSPGKEAGFGQILGVGTVRQASGQAGSGMMHHTASHESAHDFGAFAAQYSGEVIKNAAGRAARCRKDKS